MNWKNHLKYGTILTLILTIVLYFAIGWFRPLNYLLLIEILLICLITPLMPDVDHSISKINQILTMTGILIVIVGVIIDYTSESHSLNKFLITGIVMFCVVFFNAKWSKHRGKWHSITAAILLGLFVWWISKSYELGTIASFGYWTHLLCDKIPLKVL